MYSAQIMGDLASVNFVHIFHAYFPGTGHLEYCPNANEATIYMTMYKNIMPPPHPQSTALCIFYGIWYKQSLVWADKRNILYLICNLKDQTLQQSCRKCIQFCKNVTYNIKMSLANNQLKCPCISSSKSSATPVYFYNFHNPLKHLVVLN